MIGFILSTVLTLTTGAVFVMWLGEQITARGIGNGMSLLIFAGIVAGPPTAIRTLSQTAFVTRAWSFPIVFLLLFVYVFGGALVAIEVSRSNKSESAAKAAPTLGVGWQSVSVRGQF